MKSPALFAATALLCVSAHAQTPPIVSQNYDKGTAGWMGIGGSARLDTSSDPARVRAAGKPVLQFDYTVEKKTLNALILPVTPGDWAKAGSLAFGVRTDADTALVVTVEEEGGGRWTSLAQVKKGAWQSVALGTADFVLSRDGDAPPDPNGKLDVDKVRSVSLLDAAQFFLRIEDANFKALMPAVSEGPRQMLLADFTVTETPPAGGAAFRLDGHNRPQVGWVTLGNVALSRAGSTNPTEGPALEARYTQQPMKLVALIRGLPAGALAAGTALNLTLAAEKTTTLMVQLEDHAGGKFSARVEVEGGKVGRKVVLSLNEFQPEGDSKTQKLDRKQIKQLLIGDIGGFLIGEAQPQVLWIGAVEAK